MTNHTDTLDNVNNEVNQLAPPIHVDTHIGETITLDGRADVYERAGKQIIVPMREEPFRGLPKKWRARHEQALLVADLFIKQIKAKGQRQVPLMRKELIKFGIDKQILKDLHAFGMLMGETLHMQSKGQQMGGEHILYLSEQAKAYLKLKEQHTAALKQQQESQAAKIAQDAKTITDAEIVESAKT